MSGRTKFFLIIVLLVCLFALAWFAVNHLSGPAAVIEEGPATGETEEPVQPLPEEPAAEPDGIAWNYDEFPEDYTFRNDKLLSQHYEKHGAEMGFASKEDYEAAANLVIHHPDVLHKIEQEDGDTCFYLESANAFVVLSTDGYIRTFFCPDSGKKYYDKQ